MRVPAINAATRPTHLLWSAFSQDNDFPRKTPQWHSPPRDALIFFFLLSFFRVCVCVLLFFFLMYIIICIYDICYTFIVYTICSPNCSTASLVSNSVLISVDLILRLQVLYYEYESITLTAGHQCADPTPQH